jgi:HEAT repeat protein
MPLVKGETGERPARGEERGLDAWLGDLRDARPEVRREAAVALEAWPEAALDIAARLSVEDDPEVRSALAIPLLAHPSPEIARRLAEIVRSDDPARRTLAVDLLRQMPPACAEVLDELLGDADPDVRVLVVNALQQVPRAEVEGRLLARLPEERDANVVGAILEALLELGTAACRPEVEALWARFAEEAFIVFAADAVLERLEARSP